MRHAHPARSLAFVVACASVALGLACAVSTTAANPDGAHLAVGKWGGANAGALVDDTLAHVHVGCTYGNFRGPIPLDASGRFSVDGEFLLRAYPIAIGPTMPAKFTGVVVGTTLTMTVAVSDTIAGGLVVLGPVSVTYGREPMMGPCPICRVPRPL
jgi:hypothetical protein